MVIGLNVSNSSATRNTRQFVMNTSHSSGRPRRDSRDAGASRNACVDAADPSDDDLEAGDLIAIGWMVSRCSARVQQDPFSSLRPRASARSSLRLTRPSWVVVPIGLDCVERRRPTMGTSPHLAVCTILPIGEEVPHWNPRRYGTSHGFRAGG
jgi:hypothetical protein